MVRVSTFCPRCGESIETEVPDEARVSGRAELGCPACRFEFVIAPARRDTGAGVAPEVTPPEPRTGGAQGPVRVHGASRTPRGPRPISFKPLAAGLMLVFAAVIGLWMGSVLVFSDDLVETGFSGMKGEGVFTGRVTTPDGEPVEGVRVQVVRGPDGDLDPPDQVDTTTGPDGRYAFEDLETGVHTFRFTHANRTTVSLEAPVYPSDYSPLFGDASAFGTVTMPAGGPTETKEVSRLDEFERLARVWGWFTIAASVMALVGSWAALRRRGYALAIIGAVAGILTFGFLIGSLVSVLALVLILFSRKEFQPLKDKGEAA